MNKNKIIMISIISVIIIVLLVIFSIYLIKLNKINPLFITEKITISKNDYQDLKFKVVNLEDKIIINKIKKLSNKIDLEKDVDYDFAINKDYTIDFNNGTSISIQSDKEYGYIKSKDLEKVIIIPQKLFDVIKENI